MMYKFFIELKNRSLLTFNFFICATLTCYFYKEFLFYLIIKTTASNKNFTQNIYFIFTNVAEVFYTYTFLIFTFSIQIALYYTLYHFYFFFAPALFEKERRTLKFLFTLSFSCLLVSTLFSYFVGIENTWNFFLKFQNFNLFYNKKIYFEIKLFDYAQFCVATYYYFFLCFQVISIAITVYSSKKIESFFLKKFKRVHYFFCLLLTIILSPPDPLIQIAVFFFNFVTFEFCNFIFILKIKVNY